MMSISSEGTVTYMVSVVFRMCFRNRQTLSQILDFVVAAMPGPDVDAR